MVDEAEEDDVESVEEESLVLRLEQDGTTYTMFPFTVSYSYCVGILALFIS